MSPTPRPMSPRTRSARAECGLPVDLTAFSKPAFRRRCQDSTFVCGSKQARLGRGGGQRIAMGRKMLASGPRGGVEARIPDGPHPLAGRPEGPEPRAGQPGGPRGGGASRGRGRARPGGSPPSPRARFASLHPSSSEELGVPLSGCRFHRLPPCGYPHTPPCTTLLCLIPRTPSRPPAPSMPRSPPPPQWPPLRRRSQSPRSA